MDANGTYDDLTWALIVSALEGSLSPEEELQFSQWLTSSEVNRERYAQLSRIWKEGMTDYPVYAGADETEAWEALQRKTRRTVPMGRWLAIAAMLLLTAGAGWWYFAGRDQVTTYQTASGEQKEVILPDGSTVALQPHTRIVLAPGYNRRARTIQLIGGQASFTVVHQAGRPFKVEMDAAYVQDMGTSFTIDKTVDSIKVTVTSGKIAFYQKKTGKTRELTEGGSICLYTDTAHAGELRETDALRFVDAPLSQVLAALEHETGRKIRMDDTSLLQKRLTIGLGGESLENALQVLCASLHLVYTEKEGVITLSVKK